MKKFSWLSLVFVLVVAIVTVLSFVFTGQWQSLILIIGVVFAPLFDSEVTDDYLLKNLLSFCLMLVIGAVTIVASMFLKRVEAQLIMLLLFFTPVFMKKLVK